MGKKLVAVECADCHSSWNKRADSIAEWHGRCRSCAQMEAAKAVGRKERMAELARRQVLAQGGIPNGHRFSTENSSGEKNHKWNGGKPACSNCLAELSTYTAKTCAACKWGKPWFKRTIVKHSDAAMRKWKASVLERDNYMCQFCGAKDYLTADHVASRKEFPDLLYVVANGRTLCWPCHKKTDTYGWYTFKRMADLYKAKMLSNGSNWLITGAG